MNKHSGWWVVVAVIVVIAGYIGWRWWVAAPHAPVAVPAASVSQAAAPQVLPQATYPITQARVAGASSAASPMPATSVSGVNGQLAALVGPANLAWLRLKDDAIGHIVATVDALPHHQLGVGVLPVRRPGGRFISGHWGADPVIARRNYARYGKYMAAIEHVDSDALVAWYVRHYPAFQSAYAKLGYGHAYFNDRLVTVLDLLLATPQPTGPVKLVQAHANTNTWRFANPQYEALSTGQKMLLRSGPDNEAKIKAKLRAIRADLIGAKLPAGAATAATSG